MVQTGQRTFSASNYHDLVDMPFFVGQFDLDSARISGTWVRFASYPSGSVTGGPRIAVWEALKLLIPPEVKVFGEVPWNTYSVLQIADPSYGGGSGLEHQNSHVDVLNPGMLGTPVLPSLYAHEIFHAWNVKRLRPSDLWPYRYDQEQPTPLLWISEGITDPPARWNGGDLLSKGFARGISARHHYPRCFGQPALARRCDAGAVQHRLQEQPRLHVRRVVGHCQPRGKWQSIHRFLRALHRRA
jgi:hypothetical protein